MSSPSFRIEPLPGYTPAIGRLVGMMHYARGTTLTAVHGLSIEQLDHLHDDASNSIGALLAHIAVVERAYQVLLFEDRRASPTELAGCEPALTLGDNGRRVLRGQPLEHYLDDLNEARSLTLQSLATRDDEWLERPLPAAAPLNAHWSLFHVAEDEINHRGQIRWLRARLPT